MANGNFADGNGTVENPYLIEDAFDLDAVRNNLTANYKLINDIDLGVSPFNEGEGWSPIGDNSTSNNNSRFQGTFDGNGFVIKNLFINRPSISYQALFGFAFGSSIKDVGIKDVNVTGGNITGGLIGTIYSSSVINSYSTGNVTGGNNTGGLIGFTHSSSVIKNSYSTGSVTGGSDTGGLVGDIGSSSVIENSYWDKETSGWTTSAGGTGKTTLEMKTVSTFVGWENETLDNGTLIWILNDGEYPKLWFEVSTNKTLILHQNEYKKWNEKTNTLFDTNRLNPIMTSDITPSGIASASSQYDTSRTAWKAFADIALTGASNMWLSASGKIKDEWIQYVFSSPVKVEAYSFMCFGTSDYENRMPKKWEVYGSSDGVNFNLISVETNQDNWKHEEVRYFEIENSDIFTHYRFKIIENNGDVSYVGLSKIMFHNIKRKKSNATFSTQQLSNILSEGMDSLSPLLDRKVTELEPQPMEDKTSILLGSESVGKVFSKTIDLGKYMDIRNIKVEVR